MKIPEKFQHRNTVKNESFVPDFHQEELKKKCLAVCHIVMLNMVRPELAVSFLRVSDCNASKQGKIIRNTSATRRCLSRFHENVKG